MRNNIILAAFMVATVTMLSSCQALGDIFKAGMWVGVIVVVLVIALVLWLIRKLF